MSTEKLTWYVARSGGIVAWCLLALSLVLGLLLSSRVLGRRASPAWILSIHRFLGGLGVIFTAVHVIAIMLDDFVDFGFTDVLVPWASEWKPGPVAWGIIAMYLSVAIELTSFAMKRLPRRLWRAVHWTSAPLFVTATVHGYQSGTDAGRAFIVAIVVSMVLLAALTIVRIVRASRKLEPAHDPRRMVAEAKARKHREAELAVVDDPGPPAEPAPAPFDHEAAATPEPHRPVHEEPTFAAPLPEPQPLEPGEPAFGDPNAVVDTSRRPASESPPRPAPPLEPVAPALPAPRRTPPPSPAPAEFEPTFAAVRAAADLEPVGNGAPMTAGVGSNAATAPRPAWDGADDPLAWLSADPMANPEIRRREGPVPGVWKRSRRNLDDYVESDT
jgi:DMSO/TMAO reductase YedYZ heme-binding membrane subunit